MFKVLVPDWLRGRHSFLNINSRKRKKRKRFMTVMLYMKHLLVLVLVLVLPCVVGIGGGSVSGDCPVECRCESVGTLQRVDCVNAGLRSLPPNLSNFTVSLHLDANFLSCLPASSFKGLLSLRYLWLDDNTLTEVPVLALSHLMGLQALTLALNNISYIPDQAFAALHQLMVLHLHNNLITSVGRRSFNGLYNLETLDLSFNRINSFPSAIKHLKNLRHLNLQNNEISVIPENSIRNPSIQTINIQNNPLHTVSTLLPNIQRLALSSVRLSSSCLLRLKHLKSLNLQLRVSTNLQHKMCGYKTSVSSFSSSNSSTPSGGLDLSLFYFSISFIFVISVLFSLLLLTPASLCSSCFPRDTYHFLLIIVTHVTHRCCQEVPMPNQVAP